MSPPFLHRLQPCGFLLSIPLALYGLLRRLAGQGYAVLVVLQQLADALRFADRALLMSPDGHVRMGTTGEVVAVAPVRDSTGSTCAMTPGLSSISCRRRGCDELAQYRLREAGLEVFDFGEMRGLATLLPNLRALGALLGRPERGAQLAARFARRIQQVSAGVPPGQRPDALYLGIHGDKLYGGTDGSSYNDVITAAGLQDVAEAQYDGRPSYTSEQLIALNPQIIVTTLGMERSLCSHPGLDRLRACRRSGLIVGLPGALIGSPGLDMIEAAETIFEAVYLRRKQP